MSSVSLPENIAALFDSFAPLSADQWMQQVAEDLGTDEPGEALKFDTGEGFSLRAFYRADDPEAKPVAIPAQPEATQRSAYLPLHNGFNADSLDLALSSAPQHLHLSVTDDASITSTAFESLAAHHNHSATKLHLDGGLASVSLSVLADALQAHTETLNLDLPSILATSGVLSRHAVEAAKKAVRQWPSSTRVISADGRCHRNAGGTIVDELAGMLGSLTDSLDLLDASAPLEELHQRVFFLIPVGRKALLQAAKLRAIRVLHERWASAYLDDPPPAYIVAVSSKRSETTCDPHSNVLRATSAAAAAHWGGADVFSARPFDAIAGDYTTSARRLADNTALILDHETDFSQHSRAAEGSYFLEAATREIVKRSWEKFLWLEDQGGLISALRSGSWQREIAESRRKLFQQVRTREQVLVGTSNYADPDDACKSASEVESDESSAASGPIKELDVNVLRNENGCTVAEMHQLFLQAPVHTEADSLPSIRLADPFEALRKEVASTEEHLGRTIEIQILTAGPPALRSGKIQFTRNYLAAAGLKADVVNSDAGENGDLQKRQVDADVLIICAPDSTAAQLCRRIRAQEDAASPFICIASSPTDALKEAGADFFIFKGSDVPETIRHMLSSFQA